MPTMPHRRRETRAERERGSMHVMTIPVAVGLLTVAVLVVSMLGTATSDRRQAGAAADAAALAATQEWNEHLGLLHALHLTVSEPGAFWGLAEEALLTPSLEREMREAARAYAEDNGAELAALDIDTQRLRVTVRVRHEDAVPGTSVRPEATATAGVRLRGGLCLTGGGLGWLLGGECRTEPEEEPDEGADGGSGEGAGGGGSGGSGGDSGDDEGGDSGDDEGGEEDPPWTRPDVGAYRSSVTLVG